MLQPAALLVAALLLAGCTPSEPAVTPVPEPSVTPIFATDEDALAAATEAYAKYLEVSDEIFANGGEGSEALSDVLVGKQLEVEENSFLKVQQNGWHSVGATALSEPKLQQYDRSSLGPSIVVAYFCEDISGADVLDATGNSVRSDDLAERSLYEVTFDLKPESYQLLVSDRNLWESGKC